MNATTTLRRVKQSRRLRTYVRCGAFAAAVLLLLPLSPWPWTTMAVPALSPFVAIATVVATRSAGASAIIGLPIVLAVLLRRRWFCRWLCPVGLLSEYAGRLSGVSPRRCRRVPSIGKAVVLLSIAASCVGYPLLLWLDPLAIFSGLFGLGHTMAGSAALVSAGVFAVLIALSAVAPGVWCLKLCPLGATQDLLSVPGKMLFSRKKVSQDVGSRALPRRAVLGMGVWAGLGAALGWAGRTRGTGRGASVLRPPGAVAGWQFPQLCLRCGNCVRACPAEIIRPDWKPDAVGGLLAPMVVFETDYCREDCTDCMRVCPSGAIVQGGIEEKRGVRIGRAQVDMDRCLLALDRECREMCMKSCPYEAIRLHQWRWEDDRRYPIIDNAKCPGCGACVLACTPMDAITVLPPGDEENKLSNVGKPYK